MIISELLLFISICIILITLFIVLVERKFLAYAQRRMGPTLAGRNGFFQIVLDLVKLISKEIFLIPKPTAALAPFFLFLLYTSQLFFSQNIIFDSMCFSISNVDSMVLHHLILILIGNIFFSLVGFLSQSRYAMLGIIRGLIHVISLDIFITIIFSTLVFFSQSANFFEIIWFQTSLWFFFALTPIVFSFIILVLLEAKRTPFDHAETEAEVVAGYCTEYSGSMLLFFFLTEYLHLFISGIHFIIFFLGGWYVFSINIFLPSFFFSFSNFILF